MGSCRSSSILDTAATEPDPSVHMIFIHNDENQSAKAFLIAYVSACVAKLATLPNDIRNNPERKNITNHVFFEQNPRLRSFLYKVDANNCNLLDEKTLELINEDSFLKDFKKKFKAKFRDQDTEIKKDCLAQDINKPSVNMYFSTYLVYRNDRKIENKIENKIEREEGKENSKKRNSATSKKNPYALIKIAKTTNKSPRYPIIQNFKPLIPIEESKALIENLCIEFLKRLLKKTGRYLIHPSGNRKMTETDVRNNQVSALKLYAQSSNDGQSRKKDSFYCNLSNADICKFKKLLRLYMESQKDIYVCLHDIEEVAKMYTRRNSEWAPKMIQNWLERRETSTTKQLREEMEILQHKQ